MEFVELHAIFAINKKLYSFWIDAMAKLSNFK